MNLYRKSARALMGAILGFGVVASVNAQTQPGDHTLRLESDQPSDTGAHDVELSTFYSPTAPRSFNETFTLIVDKLLQASAFVTENIGIEQFTSFGLYSGGNLVAGSTLVQGDRAGADLIVTDLLPGTYEFRIAGTLNNESPNAAWYSVSANAVATPIPAATWFFAPAIATVFGLRRRKGRLLQSA